MTSAEKLAHTVDVIVSEYNMGAISRGEAVNRIATAVRDWWDEFCTEHGMIKPAPDAYGTSIQTSFEDEEAADIVNSIFDIENEYVVKRDIASEVITELFDFASELVALASGTT